MSSRRYLDLRHIRKSGIYRAGIYFRLLRNNLPQDLSSQTGEVFYRRKVRKVKVCKNYLEYIPQDFPYLGRFRFVKENQPFANLGRFGLQEKNNFAKLGHIFGFVKKINLSQIWEYSVLYRKHIWQIWDAL